MNVIEECSLVGADGFLDFVEDDLVATLTDGDVLCSRWEVPNGDRDRAEVVERRAELVLQFNVVVIQQLFNFLRSSR